jgi:hypothetical protein
MLADKLVFRNEIYVCGMSLIVFVVLMCVPLCILSLHVIFSLQDSPYFCVVPERDNDFGVFTIWHSFVSALVSGWDKG